MRQHSPEAHWLDKPANIRRVWRGFLLALALTVALELFVPTHPHFDVEQVFGFNAWYGFIVCAAMIVVAKALALLLKRADTYYDQNND